MQRIMKAVVAVTAACLLAAAPAVAFANEDAPTVEVVTPEVVEPAPEVAPEPEVEAPAPPAPEPEVIVVEAAAPEAAPQVQAKTQPEHICAEAGYETKVDTQGDPATVEVTAPAGFLIDSYCVKAGTTKHIIPVDPPAATVVINHPDKDSVSHYQVRLVPVPDEEEPETPAPLSCTAVSANWYTEHDDLAPVATESGLVFTGGSGKAVGLRLPVTGNLQGWTSVSFDSTDIADQFFFRIVIDASADGGKAYQSLSFPGYTVIDQASVSYQFGESIAATALRFPNAVVTSVGFQTNSGAPADFSVTLFSATGACGTFGFVPDPLPEDYSVPGEWSAGEFECDDTSYVETRVVDYYTYSRDESGAVVETVTQETEERTVEREADCPVVVTPEPEPEAEATPAPAAAPESKALAATGGPDMRPLLFGGALAFVFGVTALIAAGIRRAKR